MNWINEWLNENLWNSNYHLSSQLSGGHWVLQQSPMIEINLSIVSPNPKIIQISESDATYLPPRLPLALPQFHRAYLGVLHLVYASSCVCFILCILADIYWAMYMWESLTSGSGHLPGNSSYYFFHGICTKGSRPVQFSQRLNGSWKIIANSVCRILSYWPVSHGLQWLPYQKGSTVCFSEHLICSLGLLAGKSTIFHTGLLGLLVPRLLVYVAI